MNKKIQQSQKYFKLDQYQIDLEHQIGSGNYGVVYKGYYANQQKSWENNVLAIKCIPLTAKLQVTDSMLTEINLLRRLQHQNIVKFIDAKKTKDHMYLILEYCNEGTLESLIKNTKLSEEQILDYFAQICFAFEYLCKNDVLHGDVKPGNILLHNAQCKLADFGVSKNANQNQQNITMRGTNLYMAPQIMNGEPYKSKSDIWSLGITLYYMFFKDVPWDYDIQNKNQILQQIVKSFDFDEFIKNKPLKRKLSDFSINLLRKMIVVDEDKRISWDELFDLVLKDKKQYLLDNESTKLESELDLSQQVQVIDDMEENAKIANKKYYLHNEIVLKGREARNQLELEIQKADFFAKVAKQLEEQNQEKNNIPPDLFIKCIFLLWKRSYILINYLFQLINFTNVNISGTIEIEQSLWKSFINCNDWKIELGKLRYIISQKKFQYQEMYKKYCQEFCDAFMNLQSFKRIERGDAYNQESLEESENLIMAFNDNFIELFCLFYEEIQTVRKKINICLNTQIIKKETNINLLFMYDIIGILCFRNIQDIDMVSKLNKYYEDKLECDYNEIIYRIDLMYDYWIIKQNIIS